MKPSTTLTDGRNILIRCTDDTPRVEIQLHKSVCSIAGNLHCIDPSVFFSPLFAWAGSFVFPVGKFFTVELYLSHINSSSAAYLIKFMRTLISARPGSEGVVVFRWVIQEGDLEMEETARLFNEVLDGRIEIGFIDGKGNLLERRSEVFNRTARYSGDGFFISKFSHRYGGNVMVLNPLFFLNRNHNRTIE